MIPEKKKRLATLIQNRMLFSLLLDTISPKYRPLFIVKVWMLKCEKKNLSPDFALLLALASYQFALSIPYYLLFNIKFSGVSSDIALI